MTLRGDCSQAVTGAWPDLHRLSWQERTVPPLVISKDPAGGY
jgi:hypothetical protein